jgi:hypothetical protein
MPNPYFGADAHDDLTAIFGASALGLDSIGFDNIGSDLEDLAADKLAADIMFGADSPQAKAAAKRLVRHARPQQAAVPQLPPAMMALLKQGIARMADKQTFTNTDEGSTQIKNEMLPIPPTTVPANSTITIPVRPIRSQRIDSVIFPSSLQSTAGCRLLSVTILGIDQLNGPGGIRCSALTEVRTDRNLKGGTAQAGQDVLVTIQNTTAGDLVIEGHFEGPDLVRST